MKKLKRFKSNKHLKISKALCNHILDYSDATSELVIQYNSSHSSINLYAVRLPVFETIDSFRFPINSGCILVISGDIAKFLQDGSRMLIRNISNGTFQTVETDSIYDPIDLYDEIENI